MVAYSFKARFAEPILAGSKRHTIRAERKRHAREGEELQLYTGMRTRQCRLLGRSVCIGVFPVMLSFFPGFEYFVTPGRPRESIDEFARSDGFADWAELRAFWAANHPGIDEFHGHLIAWGELIQPENPIKQRKD